MFKDFTVWVREKRAALDALKPLPSNSELMATFRPAERDHWRECESEAEGRRQLVADGEVPEGIVGTVGGAGYGAIGNENGVGAPEFTVSMFARLRLILRDDDEARLAHAGSGQSLTKEQQQNRVSRDDFWDAVAARFNDASLRPHVDVALRGAPVGDIDPSLAPSTPVSGGKLKKVWYDMRGPYTTAHDNFSKSGQHNGTLMRFLDFVQANGNGDLYAGSKRAVIMFVVMRVGSDIPGSPVTAMLDLTLRIISNGRGFDDGGGGTHRSPGTQNSSGSSGGREGDVPGGKRRKKNVCEDTRFLCDHIKGLTDSISAHGEDGRQRSGNVDVRGTRQGNGSVGDQDIRHTNNGVESQALSYMETRIKAVELVNKSYALVVAA